MFSITIKDLNNNSFCHVEKRGHQWWMHVTDERRAELFPELRDVVSEGFENLVDRWMITAEERAREIKFLFRG